jgi:hypothetical protein
MSHTYAGTNTYPANVTLPDDGDARTASSVNAALEGLADRTTYLNARRSEIQEVFYAGSAVDSYSVLTTTTSSTYVDVTDATVGTAGILTLATTTIANDIIVIDARARLNLANAGEIAYGKMQFSENGGAWADLPGSGLAVRYEDAADAVKSQAFAVRRVVVAAGTFRLKFLIKNTGGVNTVGFAEAWSVRCTVIRPA